MQLRLKSDEESLAFLFDSSSIRFIHRLFINTFVQEKDCLSKTDFSSSYLLETCDLQLFNEILTILLNELQRKPSSATANKKSASTEANTTSKFSRSCVSSPICFLSFS